ncbi:hypothetical protein ACFVH6_41720 [Spirillospora sp. NPDC127200]
MELRDIEIFLMPAEEPHFARPDVAFAPFRDAPTVDLGLRWPPAHRPAPILIGPEPLGGLFA